MSRFASLEEPPATKPSRKRITEELMSELAGVSYQAFSELVVKMRGLDEDAQADVLLLAIAEKVEAGDLDMGRRLMRVFTSLFPKYERASA